MPILPPATIGILGSGQLGRMLAIEAKKMGYRVAVFSPATDTPTGQVADVEVSGDYLDLAAVKAFAEQVDVMTYEFENVPSETAVICANTVPLRPGARALEVAQNRLREKSFFVQHGLPTVDHAAVHSLDELQAALDTVKGTSWILKTATSGYDGKGQIRINHKSDAASAWNSLNQQPAILEEVIDFDYEISVVGARDINGNFAHYGILRNDHHNHILDVTTSGEWKVESGKSPNSQLPAPNSLAIQSARTILEKLDVIGVLCTEFFVAKNGNLYVNEIAPRPHNSGHLTIDACVTNQFEQQLRAICGLPLGATDFLQPAAMANLLGDLWQPEPAWANALALPNVHLHLYGKADARIGRKMGHLTALAPTAHEAQTLVRQARQALLETT